MNKFFANYKIRRRWINDNNMQIYSLLFAQDFPNPHYIYQTDEHFRQQLTIPVVVALITWWESLDSQFISAFKRNAEVVVRRLSSDLNENLIGTSVLRACCSLRDLTLSTSSCFRRRIKDGPSIPGAKQPHHRVNWGSAAEKQMKISNERWRNKFSAFRFKDSVN